MATLDFTAFLAKLEEFDQAVLSLEAKLQHNNGIKLISSPIRRRHVSVASPLDSGPPAPPPEDTTNPTSSPPASPHPYDAQDTTNSATAAASVPSVPPPPPPPPPQSWARPRNETFPNCGSRGSRRYSLFTTSPNPTTGSPRSSNRRHSSPTLQPTAQRAHGAEESLEALAARVEQLVKTNRELQKESKVDKVQLQTFRQFLSDQEDSSRRSSRRRSSSSLRDTIGRLVDSQGGVPSKSPAGGEQGVTSPPIVGRPLKGHKGYLEQYKDLHACHCALGRQHAKVTHELAEKKATVAKLRREGKLSTEASRSRLLGALRRIEYLLMEKADLQAKMKGKEDYLSKVEAFILLRHRQEIGPLQLPPPPCGPAEPRVKGVPYLGPPRTLVDGDGGAESRRQSTSENRREVARARTTTTTSTHVRDGGMRGRSSSGQSVEEWTLADLGDVQEEEALERSAGALDRYRTPKARPSRRRSVPRTT